MKRNRFDYDVFSRLVWAVLVSANGKPIEIRGQRHAFQA